MAEGRDREGIAIKDFSPQTLSIDCIGLIQALQKSFPFFKKVKSIRGKKQYLSTWIDFSGYKMITHRKQLF